MVAVVRWEVYLQLCVLHGLVICILCLKLNNQMIELVCADKLKTSDESVIVNGIQYSPTDHQRSPSQQVQYTLTLDAYEGKFSSIDKNESPSE
ncbi:hypothetical protein VSVS12_03715 [Vibrio scophthalmi]|nr:hypothetical protein VSVS12_03715 [Vibrio scophthalmi]